MRRGKITTSKDGKRARITLTCAEAMDIVYDGLGEEDPPALPIQLRLGLHLFFCPRCAEETRRLELIEGIASRDFFPAPSRDLTAAVMEQLRAAEAAGANPWGLASGEEPGGFSFRGWVLAGCFVLLSLSTVFLGLDFNRVASVHGSSFLVPVGIVVGVVVSGYGALFIGSHLKELSDRFRLHGD